MTQQRHCLETTSAEATRVLGEAIGSSLVGGLTIGLVGPLGAGKTQLVKGIAAGNDIEDDRQVTSPTFALVHEYPGRLGLYHVDLYRLRGARDLIALGFDEWLRSDAVVVIEWAERARSILPQDSLWVELQPTGDTSRRITLRADGETAMRCLDGVRTACR